MHRKEWQPLATVGNRTLLCHPPQPPKQLRSRPSRLLLEIWLWLEEEGPADGHGDRGVFIQGKKSDVDSIGPCQLLPEGLG